MNTKVRRWLPIALCCLPGVAAVVVLAIGSAAGGAALGGSLRLVLIAFAMLACPLSMGLMMRRGSHRNSASGASHTMTDCCAPGEQTSIAESDRLAALRTRREALEHEVAELQAGRGSS